MYFCQAYIKICRVYHVHYTFIVDSLIGRQEQIAQNNSRGLIQYKDAI